MNSKNILIATGLLLIASSLLSGCTLVEMMPGGSEKAPVSDTVSEAESQAAAEAEASRQEIQELVQQAEQAKKTVSLNLMDDLKEDSLTVTIQLDNPEQNAIASAQTWLSYDTSVLKGVSISDEGSDFDLMAPYDNSFDDINGLVMVGRAATEPQTGESLKVVDVVFEVIGAGALMVNAYDYREALSGHMSANTLIEEKPHNILIKPENPVLAINPSEQ